MVKHSLGTGSSDLPAAIDQLVEGFGAPGAAVGVATATERRIAVGGVVSQRGAWPVTADTLFQIGSITKLFTATAVLRLVDQGRFALDDAVSTLVPRFALADRTVSSRVTVRHLLAHVSGIPSDNFEAFGYGDDCLERHALDLARHRPESDPGVRFSYSNAGYSLAGHLIERITAQVYDDALRDLVLAPLLLSRATLHIEEAVLHPLAVGHVSDASGNATVTPRYASVSRAVGPEGLLKAPVDELLTFALGAWDLLAPATTAEAQRPQVDVLDVMRTCQSWGLGWAIYATFPKLVLGHNGGIGGQQAWLRVVPEDGVAVAVLVNRDLSSRSEEIVRQVVAPLLAAQTGVTGIPVPVSGGPPIEDASRYAGRYGRLNLEWSIEEAEGALVASTELGGPLLRDGGRPIARVPLVPVERDVFRVGHASGPFLIFRGDDVRDRPSILYAAGRAHRRAGDPREDA